MTTRLWDAPFTVNTTTAGFQENARTATLADGRFIVVWDDVDTDSIRFQIYGSDGQPDGAEQTHLVGYTCKNNYECSRAL